MRKFLVFTDLDGTLLNHKDYSWLKAEPALKALNDAYFPLIINSSKTASEIILLMDKIGIKHPFISENGSVVNIPCGYFNNGQIDLNNSEAHFFGRPYNFIRNLLNELRNKYNFKFTGFGDLTDKQLSIECNFSPEQAALAKQREASEPIIWQGSDEDFKKFTALLQENDLTLIKGGRFYNVMADIDKGSALSWLKNIYEKKYPDIEWLTIGLGDSYNDVRMLEIVDFPVLVMNKHVSQPDLAHLPNLKKTQSPAPEGWNEAITEILKQYSDQRRNYG